MNVSVPFIVDEEQSGQRLDIWLTAQWPALSRSVIQKYILSKDIYVNDKPAQASTLLKAGDEVICKNPDSFNSLLEHALTQKPSLWQPENMELDIVFEDDYLLVINKPPGIIIHPGAGRQQEKTLIQGVMAYLGIGSSLQPDVPPRCGLVHRLDKDTSGVIVIAKDGLTHKDLTQQFHQRTTYREYVALLDGCLSQPAIRYESYLYRCPTSRTRYTSMEIDEAKKTYNASLPAYFHYACSQFVQKVSFAKRFDLCTIKLSTGRTHQIRVHAQHLKTPVLGDKTYKRHRKCRYGAFLKEMGLSSGSLSTSTDTQPLQLSGQLLHARYLGFKHPHHKTHLTFSSPLPDEFKTVLKTLYPYAHSPHRD
ncbi:MAG: RluA family pseudouridine synthase [Proteobacteria bacterium]|nr:RluA family pseudouridine synthase [Pseudomonadota bacterium]